MISQTCTTNGAGLDRVRFFARQLLTADDLIAEQAYFRQKLRRHNRFLHGWGAVCGLKVTAAPSTKIPWRVKIDGGYALGPWGDEIYVAEPVCFDLTTCVDSLPDPCEPNQPPKPVPPQSGKVYLAIRYVECETRPVRIHPLGCACDDTLCEYSRIRDDYEIACLTEPPPSEPPRLLCELLAEGHLAACPPCPVSPWVVLAQVTLPVATPGQPEPTSIPIADSAIDNLIRRQLFSTAVLQEQLIACCCEPPPPPVNAADLAISLVGNVDFRSVVYTINVANNGPSLAKDVRVENIAPPNMANATEFTTTQGSWTQTAPPTFIAQLGDLPAGATVRLGFRMIVPRNGGTFKNTVTVKSTTPDPVSTNNSATVSNDFGPLIA